ncbi:WSC domain-containing protein [Podospora aff. communis PSN243]|uniref:WSC domain-containing protein n=1 Tax=Podospora aff. communis PSN243 TaxID=3040156 RepID=A0AAV9GN15_9PEZI|nr:WSC domain-containing protein [Podospora aff. communis PSN243]
MAFTRSTTTTLLYLVHVHTLLANAAPALQDRQDRQDQIFYHLGCYSGFVGGNRALRGPSYTSDDMTVEKCAVFCNRNRYFGLEYGRECYCGDVQTASPTVSPSECSFTCPGNPTQKCGAGDRQNLYINLVYFPRKPATLSAPYIGCFVDEGPRTLPDNPLSAGDMTAQKCQFHCAGYRYFGVEFSRECWCGRNPPNVTAPTSECSLPCAGDDAQLCGGPNRINVWG